MFSAALMSIFWPLSFQVIMWCIENSASTSVFCRNHIWVWKWPSCPLFSPNLSPGPGFWLAVLLHLVLVILIDLSLWQPERLIKLVTEISFEFQLVSFLFIEQEAIDVGEQLIWCHRGNEALPVQSEVIQQHHAEVESGDSKGLSEKRDKLAINQMLNAPLFTSEFIGKLYNSDAFHFSISRKLLMPRINCETYHAHLHHAYHDVHSSVK